MPSGELERRVLKLLAQNRNPESHVAGATILNQSEDSPRFSRDINLFHDAPEAVAVAATQDVRTLKGEGFEVEMLMNEEKFKRARVGLGAMNTKIEWVYDSAFRFFPVEADPDLGFRLSYWDAATNKVLAAAFRHAIRDYLDLLEIHQNHLSLGALIWAAAGKDDGLSPGFILEELARIQRYPAPAYQELSLARPIDPKALKRIWLDALNRARTLFDDDLLDAPYGCFFLNGEGQPVTPSKSPWPQLRPHFGSVRGCWPRLAEG